MVVTHSQIAILTTVINFDLYAKSSLLFPKNIQKYVIDGRNGMHGLASIFYMMKKLKNKNIEWLIMADEDVIFKDEALVFDLIDEMKIEDIMVCGVRDGGVILHRTYNPNLINTFFSIINFKELERIWNKSEVIKNNYIKDNEFNDDTNILKENFDSNSLYEPYYCFYLWLRREKKRFLFLDTVINEDQITNSVFYKQRIFLHHTWYARAYRINKSHTQRIDKIFGSVKFETNNFSAPIVFKDRTYFLARIISKTYQRIMRRINNLKQ